MHTWCSHPVSEHLWGSVSWSRAFWQNTWFPSLTTVVSSFARDLVTCWVVFIRILYLTNQMEMFMKMFINPNFHYICLGWVSGQESVAAKTLRDPSTGSGTAQEGPSQTGEYIYWNSAFCSAHTPYNGPLSILVIINKGEDTSAWQLSGGAATVDFSIGFRGEL